MTAFQRTVLATLFRNSESVMLDGMWAQAEDVRRSRRLAESLYWLFVSSMPSPSL